MYAFALAVSAGIKECCSSVSKKVVLLLGRAFKFQYKNIRFHPFSYDTHVIWMCSLQALRSEEN